MFPNTNNITDITETATSNALHTYAFEFKTGDFLVRDGKIVEVDGADAIRVWIEKIIRTEKGRYEIYAETEYGCRLEDLLIGGSYKSDFIEAELQREITDALLRLPQISSISGFEIKNTASQTTITFTVLVSTGVTFESEVRL